METTWQAYSFLKMRLAGPTGHTPMQGQGRSHLGTDSGCHAFHSLQPRHLDVDPGITHSSLPILLDAVPYYVPGPALETGLRCEPPHVKGVVSAKCVSSQQYYFQTHKALIVGWPEHPRSQYTFLSEIKTYPSPPFNRKAPL